MEVLEIALKLVVTAVILYWAIAIGGALLILTWLALAAILGISTGIWLWQSGYDNWGASVGIVGILLQIWWFRFAGRLMRRWDIGKSQGGDYYSWTDGKKGIYDKDGYIKGYIDKD